MLTAADIRDDDADLGPILATIPWPAAPLRKLTADDTSIVGKSTAYQEIENGRLVAHYAGRTRIVFARDWAKYLLILRRESAGKEDQNRAAARARAQTDNAKAGHRAARLARARNKAAQQEAAA